MGVRRQEGFSILEMLLVISIVAMIGMISVPQFYSNKAEIELSNLADQIAMKLVRHRATAVHSGIIQTIRINTSSREVSLPNSSAKISWSPEIKLTATGVASAYGTDVAEIRFYPDGSSSGAELKFEVGKQYELIRIAWLTGAVVRSKDS